MSVIDPPTAFLDALGGYETWARFAQTPAIHT